jgi:GNAT superfamily N-acetyltransferase
MNEKYFLKPMDTKSLDDVLQLLGREPNPELRNYYIWKYNETPSNQLGVVINTGSSKVIGFNALIKTSVIFEEESYNVAQSVDLVVHPGFRKKGIMHFLCSELYKKCKENGVALLIGWTTRYGPAWYGFIDLGWTDIGLMAVLAYPIKPFKAVRWLKLGRIRSLIIGAGLWLRKLVKHTKIIKYEDLVLDRGKWNYEEIWRCWRKSLKPGAAAVNRSLEFYKNRFAKSMWQPHEFIPISAWKNDGIVCFAICIVNDFEGGTEGIIADLHAVEGCVDGLQLVMNECVKYFEMNDADYVRLWGKKPEWVLKQLISDGFILRNRDLCFRLLSLLEREKINPQLYDFGIWDLDLCDSDHI